MVARSNRARPTIYTIKASFQAGFFVPVAHSWNTSE